MPVKPINVLYVIRTWALGGSHTIMMSLMEHLPKERFNVMCAAFDTPAKTDEVLVDALKKRGLHVLDERIPWHSRRDSARAQQAIADIIAQYKIDLVHTHDDQSNVIVGMGRKQFACACVASPYGWWRRLFPLRSHLYVFLEKWIALPRFERLITVSENMRSKILQGRSRPNRIRVIPTGIDIHAMAGGESRDATRARLGIPTDAHVVGTVSRLYEEKGHLVLFEALPKIVEKISSAHVLVLGTGPMRPALEADVARRGLAAHVTFSGFYHDLPGALRAMDMLAQPSILDEGLPTSILEAQSLGLPVVASRVGGVHESIEDGVTGLLVPKRDPDALANALIEILGNDERREAMGKASRARIERSFRLETMVESVAKTYEEALELYRNPT